VAKAYQSNPQLNAERGAQRATDENVPQAPGGLTGRRSSPSLSEQGCRRCGNLLPEQYDIQSANPDTLDYWGDRLTADGCSMASRPQIACAWRNCRCKSGSARPLRNVGQGVLLDAVTAYSNVLAISPLVEAQRSNVAFLREIPSASPTAFSMPATVTPTDTSAGRKRGSVRGQAGSEWPPKSISPSAGQPIPR